MRLWRLLAADVRFQWKYGFYLVYAVFTGLYLLALAAAPQSARRVVAAVVIFTDPAAMGLFFMGAIVLMEKSQRVHCALAVSPAREGEYMAAKLGSLMLIGLAVAGVLAVAGGVPDVGACLLGVALGSCLCSACGLIAAERSQSLNQFVLLAAPFEVALCLPPALLLFGHHSPWLMAHPGVATAWLIYGDAPSAPLCVLSLAAWCALALWLCRRSVRRYFSKAGGADA